MWEKLKMWVLDQVLWTEQNLKGKTGAEKRQAVINKLDELIKLPFYLEWADGLVIGWLVDTVCEKLNWLTDYNKAQVKLSEAEKTEFVATLDAPMPEVITAIASAKTVDERLAELCKEYEIGTEKPASDSESAKPDDFARCIAFTLKYEGGCNFNVVGGKPILKSNAVSDLGGATAYGITWATLKAAHANGIVSHNDICKLTKEEAQKIYRANYWEHYGWGELEWPVNLCCLDCCVNHGGFAWILQRAINDVAPTSIKVEVDGKFGPKTFAALKTLNSNALTLALAIVARRREYFNNIVAKNPSQKVFLKGWLNRCDALEKEVKQ